MQIRIRIQRLKNLGSKSGCRKDLNSDSELAHGFGILNCFQYDYFLIALVQCETAGLILLEKKKN
jgi:hypothetical protein